MTTTPYPAILALLTQHWAKHVPKIGTAPLSLCCFSHQGGRVDRYGWCGRVEGGNCEVPSQSYDAHAHIERAGLAKLRAWCKDNDGSLDIDDQIRPDEVCLGVWYVCDNSYEPERRFKPLGSGPTLAHAILAALQMLAKEKVNG